MSKFRRVFTYILDLEVNPKRQPLNEEDLKLGAYLIDFGESIDKGDFDIEAEQHLLDFEDDLQDLSWSPEDDEFHKIQMYPDVVHFPGKPNMIQFGHGEFVELDKVQETVAYYGSRTVFNNNGSKLRPILSQVQHKFGFIRNRNHLDKLWEYESLGFTKANRKNNLEFISMELEKEVRMHIENGKILHHSVLRFLIAGIIKEYKIDIKNFIGTESWLNAPNLEVNCHTSHIMTKELMKVFFQKIMFDSSMPKDALLIVDLWNSWKDTAAIDSVTPPSHKLKILTIPAGCTGRIQPCDVGIFGSFKKVVKTLTNYAQLTNSNYKFQTSDETLKWSDRKHCCCQRTPNIITKKLVTTKTRKGKESLEHHHLPPYHTT
ncbi:Protein CBG07795 [Caenorhabditis briggsae]|uniref:Protein CBG07795 n=1 Tax=Caenorhabditis briggsae TaxID=6238 RepID=A8X426_CAEBR|nr:Protein CBG07795 [Caenorhabditis briggsae]CAP27386.1 Protein CBG07795 [Caenorhabditis briggsae]